MADNLQICMNKCNVILQKVSNSQSIEMRRIVMKHMGNIGSKYLVDIMTAYKNKDMVTIVKITRVIIKQPEFKSKFLLLLDDVAILYKNNKSNVNEIVKCFLSHCNKESIELLHESFGMMYDLFNLLNDREITKHMEKIQEYFIENLKYAEGLLIKKSPKKPKTISKK